MISPTFDAPTITDDMHPGLPDMDSNTDSMIRCATIFTFGHPGWEKAFLGSSRKDVIYALIQYLKARRFIGYFVEVDNANSRKKSVKLLGYVLFIPDHSTKIFHLAHFLGYGRDFVRFGINAVLENAPPDYCAQAMRRGKLRRYYHSDFHKH